MLSKEMFVPYSFWTGYVCSFNISAEVCFDNSINHHNNYCVISLQEVIMKVVLIRNPKFISYFLRKFFKIPKITENQEY